MDKSTQLSNRIMPGLRRNTEQVASGSELTAELSDDLTKNVYLPEETASKTYTRAVNEGDSVRDALQRKGYRVKTFDRTGDQFTKDYEALQQAGKATSPRLLPPKNHVVVAT
jgi:hypothetical protein